MDRFGNKAINRRQFLGWAGAFGLVLSLTLGGGLLRRLSARGDRWYEVVQDLKDPQSWHINLYSGPVLGDLSRGQLVEHRLLRNTTISDIKGCLEYPARFQHLSGRREQTF